MDAVAAGARSGKGWTRHPSPVDERPQHHPVRGCIVVCLLSVHGVEIDLGARTSLDRRGQTSADTVIPRLAVRHPEPEIGRAGEAVAEQPHPAAHLPLRRHRRRRISRSRYRRLLGAEVGYALPSDRS